MNPSGSTNASDSTHRYGVGVGGGLFFDATRPPDIRGVGGSGAVRRGASYRRPWARCCAASARDVAIVAWQGRCRSSRRTGDRVSVVVRARSRRSDARAAGDQVAATLRFPLRDLNGSFRSPERVASYSQARAPTVNARALLSTLALYCHARAPTVTLRSCGRRVRALHDVEMVPASRSLRTRPFAVREARAGLGRGDAPEFSFTSSCSTFGSRRDVDERRRPRLSQPTCDDRK